MSITFWNKRRIENAKKAEATTVEVTKAEPKAQVKPEAKPKKKTAKKASAKNDSNAGKKS